MKINRIEHHDQGAQVIVQGVRRVTLGEVLPDADYLKPSRRRICPRSA